MKKRDIAAITIIVVAVFAFVASAHLAEEEARTKNPKAAEAGFADYKEMEKAAAFGITNGAEWNAKNAKDRQIAAVAEAAIRGNPQPCN
jgi:hypothetical protein